jgi:TRAP-type C4-dicarboxylate transport system permease small subunit
VEQLNTSPESSSPPIIEDQKKDNSGLQLLTWIDRWILEGFEKGIIGLGLIILCIIVFTNVISRYIFDYSPVWGDELPRYMMVWITFIGMAHCVRKGAHVSMDMIFEKLSIKVKKKAYLFILVVSFAFSLLLAYKGWGLSQKVFTLNQKSVALEIPMGYIYLAIPIGALLMAKNFAHLLYQNLTSTELMTEIKEGGE